MKRLIGIDINRDKICMVQLGRHRGNFSVERTCVREMLNNESPEEEHAADIQALIKNIMTEENFATHAKVTLTVPDDRVFFHNFRTDVSKNGDVEQLLKFELEDDFPVPFDDLVAGICGGREFQGHDRELLVGALSRQDLQKWVEKVNQTGLNCSAVTSDACALHALASLCHNSPDDRHSMIIHTDGGRIILAISEKSELVCARHLNRQDFYTTDNDTSEVSTLALTREIELTLRAIFGSKIPAPLKVLISGNNEFAHGLSETLPEVIDCQIDILSLPKHIDCSDEHHTDAGVAVAVGAALVGANENAEAPNFLTEDELRSNRTAETKRSLFVFGLLLVAIGISLIANLFYQLNTLQKKHQLIKQEIRKVFVQTLPEEKRIVNELAQMTERLDTLQTEYDTLASEMNSMISPLKILQYISERIRPDQNIQISNISVAAESVRLTGVAASFESVDNLTGVLRRTAEFATVALRNADVDPENGTVRFSLLITMG